MIVSSSGRYVPQTAHDHEREWACGPDQRHMDPDRCPVVQPAASPQRARRGL